MWNVFLYILTAIIFWTFFQIKKKNEKEYDELYHVIICLQVQWYQNISAKYQLHNCHKFYYINLKNIQ